MFQGDGSPASQGGKAAEPHTARTAGLRLKRQGFTSGSSRRLRAPEIIARQPRAALEPAKLIVSQNKTRPWTCPLALSL